MRSLFVRTLLWFIATVILTFIALAMAAALDIDPQERRPFGALVSLAFDEARHAYETGGREALRAALARIARVTDAEPILTDGAGRDLLTGEDRRDLGGEVRGQRRAPYWMRGRTVIGRRSPDGRYMFFVIIQRSGAARWFLQPEINLPVLALLVALSYAFARHLTNPVRQLRNAVESFGRGDLSVRVRSGRRDELGQLALTFDQMADRIETLLAAERRLLLDISHELRSPLARLSVAVELARSGPDTTRHLDRIEREAGRLNALVGELLQVTRAESDTSRLRRERLSLDGLLNEIIDDARLEADQRGSRIEWSGREQVEIEADPELLRRAIENIIRNAVRYAPENTPVEVSTKQLGSEAIVTVRDHGPGVPAQHLARIFDPFYRVDADRDRASGGAGLGLAIARRAVELHHGRIEARNALPGLLVEIRIPA